MAGVMNEAANDNAFAQLRRHLLNIVLVQAQLLGNLLVRQVKTHEIETQNPNLQGLMAVGEARVRQIVKTAAALLVFATVALTVALNFVESLFADAAASAVRARNSVRPSWLADRCIAFCIINQVLYLEHCGALEAEVDRKNPILLLNQQACKPAP